MRPSLRLAVCFAILFASSGLQAQEAPVDWSGLQRAQRPADQDTQALVEQLQRGQAPWQDDETICYTSTLSPGALVRMRTAKVTFFTGLAAYGAEAPSLAAIKTASGTRSVGRGGSFSGSELTAPWIVCSFQGCKGWEKLDVPWLLVLQKRPTSVTLTADGLVLEFPQADTGHIFSMPLYGYYKPPQKDNDLVAKHNLPSKGIQTWTWPTGLPADVVARCDWWSSAARAYPVSFQERFSVHPSSDEIVFHHDYRWLLTQDDWGTAPTRFATLSPVLGLAWKYPGFPMTFSSPIHDPDYFTAYGPYVGALNVDRLDIRMKVLKYVHELEYLELPASLDADQKKALDRLLLGMTKKFEQPGWRMDYGQNNFVWSMVQDVWYGRGLEFVDGRLRTNALEAMRQYFSTSILKDWKTYKGKFIVEGPGIGSFGHFGDAGKFSSNMLQGIWGYGQYTGDWDLLAQRWESHVKKLFITPEESNFVTYGRNSIAEIGDEAGPCSAYARMAWALGDRDEYLFGCYMFARELVHHHVKQTAGPYFYEHQPYNHFEAMPPEIYPTHIVNSTTGWQVDGPIWGHGEHQSSNRWVRFHDPDVGRFYRDHLAEAVRKELAWYETEGLKDHVYRTGNYRGWLVRDKTHILTGLARLRSFLLGESYQELLQHARMENYKAHSPAEDVAVGYAYLRSQVPVRHRRLVPPETPASPEVYGLQMRGLPDNDKVAQEIYEGGLNLYLAWYLGRTRDFGMGKAKPESRRFGGIEGDFPAGAKASNREIWLGYGCRVRSAKLAR